MNEDRKLRTAVGSALRELNKAQALLSDKWGAIPYEKRILNDPLLVSINLVYRAIKRLEKGRAK